MCWFSRVSGLVGMDWSCLSMVSGLMGMNWSWLCMVSWFRMNGYWGLSYISILFRFQAKFIKYFHILL